MSDVGSAICLGFMKVVRGRMPVLPKAIYSKLIYLVSKML
jgi:hypothetical protein